MPKPHIWMGNGIYWINLTSEGSVRFDYEHQGEGWLCATVNHVGSSDGHESCVFVVSDVSDCVHSDGAPRTATGATRAPLQSRGYLLLLSCRKNLAASISAKTVNHTLVLSRQY